MKNKHFTLLCGKYIIVVQLNFYTEEIKLKKLLLLLLSAVIMISMAGCGAGRAFSRLWGKGSGAPGSSSAAAS